MKGISMKSELIARVAHNVNRAYCDAMGHEPQPHWDDASDEQKTSAICGVNYHKQNPESTPEESHKSWMALKQKAGWSFGVIKDIKRKFHPCFKPYERLNQSQKAKDHIFLTVVNELKDL